MQDVLMTFQRPLMVPSDGPVTPESFGVLGCCGKLDVFGLIGCCAH